MGINEHVLGVSVPKVKAAMHTEKKGYQDEISLIISCASCFTVCWAAGFHRLMFRQGKIFVFGCREPKHAGYYHLHYCELVTQGSLSSKIHPKTLSDTDFLRWHWPEQIGRATTITARPCCCVLCTKVHCLPIIFEKFEIFSLYSFLL